jgi:hypothetical protein
MNMGRLHTTRRGGSYVFVLITTSVAASIAIGGLTLRQASAERAADFEDLASARLLAQSGLEAALGALAEHADWRKHASLQHDYAIGKGKVGVEVTDPADADLSDDADDPYRVTATATLGQARAVLRADVIIPTGDEYRDRVLKASPVAYWPFDENRNTTIAAKLAGAQDAGYSMNTVPNTRKGFDGRPAPTMASTFSLAYANHHADYLLDAGTIACWVQIDSDSIGDQAIFAKNATGNNPGSIYIYASNDMMLKVRMETTYDSTDRSVHKLSPGQWHHVAVSFGPGGIEVFLDAKSEERHSGWTTGLGKGAGGSGNTLPIQIGSWYNGNWFQDSLNGSVRDVAIFSKQMTEDEIDLLVNGTPPNPFIDPDSWAWVTD